jgi:hypothetical protein
MMGRSAWPLILIMALLLSWVGPAPCAAQPQPLPLPTSTAPRAPLPAPRPFRLPSESTSPTPTSASALAPEEGDLALRLTPAPLEPTDLRFPINLATALRLSDARPLIVAAAQASVWVAEAQLKRDPGPLGSFVPVWLRLYPTRRRRPGF